MEITGEGKALAIFVDEDDRWEGKTLYMAIVERARSEGLGGATVYRGIVGFGANSRIHTAGVIRLSEDLPITIVIVDSAEQIRRFLPLVREMLGEGLVATWDLQIECVKDERALG